MGRKRSNRAPKCVHCGTKGQKLSGRNIYPHRPDLWLKVIWKCPLCPDSRVGCHGLTDVPLGKMANQETRDARMAAHAAFDKLWKRKPASRRIWYMWLAEQLAIPPHRCHIGSFTIEQCRQTVDAVTAHNQEKGRVDESASVGQQGRDSTDADARGV